MMTKTSAWILAMRLRTLPLASSSILLGSALAAAQDQFQWSIFLLALLTALLLQILSNFANDYGDALSGADNPDRIGPLRAVGSGLITPHQMRNALIGTTIITMISGVLLLFSAFPDNVGMILLFLLLGAIALFAAVRYTVGDSPYGYRGLGDLAVFIFFGLLGVLGSMVLHTHSLNLSTIPPAFASGLLATAVLNINNVRDIESDAACNKITLAVMLGRSNAVRYHYALLGAALLLTLISAVGLAKIPVLFALLAFIPLAKAAQTLNQSRNGIELTNALKATAQGAFLYALLFAIGLII